MKIAAITLMRKGSRRFQNKVIADLCGKPLYLHTVKFALELGYDYFLAHDYDYLELPAAITEIKRNQNFAGDVHKTNEEIKTFNIDADYFIFLQATNPIRDLKSIRIHIKHFLSYDYDYMLSAHCLPKGYYYQQYDFNDPEPVNFELENRTDNQELFGGASRASMFIEDGSFYMFKKSQLEKQHFSITDNFFIMRSNLPMIDINTESDLEKARKYLENKTNS